MGSGGARRPALDVRLPAADGALPPRLDALIDDYAPFAVEEAPRTTDAAGRPMVARRIHFFSAASRDAACEAVGRTLGRDGARAAAVDVPDDGWAARAQASLCAIRVGDLVVAPPWDIPRASDPPALVRPPHSGPRRTVRPRQGQGEGQGEGEAGRGVSAGGRTARPPAPPRPAPPARDPSDRVVVIDPSMGFGTGHHASTRLCLLALQQAGRRLRRSRRVLDLGTGSGILAIAAVRLGARTVTAIDDDPAAIGNARRNLALNRVDDRVVLVEADLRTWRADPADVVTANLTGGLLARHGAAVARQVAPGGLLIVSGLEPGDVAPVRAALGLAVTARTTEAGWVGLVCRRPPAAAAAR